jgi:hypothetical protein
MSSFGMLFFLFCIDVIDDSFFSSVCRGNILILNMIFLKLLYLGRFLKVCGITDILL